MRIASRLALLLLLGAAARAQPYTLTADVGYAQIAGVDPNLLSLDVYRPLGAGPFPVVVFVHGGGWHTGDKGPSVHAKADWLTAQGILLVSVNYRLSPTPVLDPAPGRLTFPTHAQDVGRALAFVRANVATLGGDPGRIALMGHSAGAHLAALVGSDPRYGGAPACVVALDTHAYDIPFYLDTFAPPVQAALYVNAFTDDAALQAEASPIQYVATAPRFLIVREENGPRSITSDRFMDALRGAGGMPEEYVAAGLDHDEINTLLGDPAEPAYTAAVGSFLGSCLGVTTGVEPSVPRDDVAVRPNPTHGRTRITLPADGAPYRIRVLDARGRVVLRAQDADLDLSRLAPGTYTIVARGRSGVVRHRVTVAR